MCPAATTADQIPGQRCSPGACHRSYVAGAKFVARKQSEAERRQRRFDGEVLGRRRVQRRLREAVDEKRLREGALGERDAAGAFACEQLNQ